MGTIGGGAWEVDGWITFGIGALVAGRTAGALPDGWGTPGTPDGTPDFALRSITSCCTSGRMVIPLLLNTSLGLTP